MQHTCQHNDLVHSGGIGDPVATFYRYMRVSRRALPRFCSVVFLCCLVTQVLHSQEIAVTQPSGQEVADDEIAVSKSHADDVAQELPATIFASPDGAAQDPQNPEPKVQNNPNPAPTYQPVTWKNLPIRVLGDQKLVWLFPLHLAQGQHILPTIGIVGVTGGLIAADAHIMVHVRNNTSAFHEYDEIFSGTNTGIVTALIPATFYIYGIARKSSYSEQTALLMGEAYLDSAIPHVAMKLVSRRLRPDVVPASSDFTDTFFKSQVSVFGKGSSFPSGHAAGIFSIATVVAERYRDHRWVPWVAYGVAAAISFSRVPTFAHFPSDVFLGAALGYTITRFDVLRDRTH
jgi:membrane-associated phospholipid phosphatase